MDPWYDLAEWQEIAETVYCRLTKKAQQDAEDLGFDDEDVLDCCLMLDRSHFHKTMEAEKAPGLWQDVYKITYQGVRLYVKIQKNSLGEAVVISFKEDTSW